MVKLVISDNEGTTTVVPLVRDEVSIGRKEGNTIRLTERNVSRDHARLLRREEAYEIQDLRSYNGTLVNGRPIDGTHSIRPGDEVRIGDYSITVQDDQPVAAPLEAAPPAITRPGTPARIVMLGDPSPGAEFSLPAEGTVVLGRSEDLQIPINHRSVSREHAEITGDGDHYNVRDLNSANGVNVNGRKASAQVLTSGDVVELGQVMFRFVGPGEHYFFDPNDAAKYRRALTQKSRANARLAATLLASAVVIALFVLFSGEEEAPAPTDVTPVASVNTVADRTTPAVTAAPEAEDGYASAMASCRDAIDGGRFAEAMAHAAMALKARAGDAAALSCQADAQRQHDDEQTFVRGKAALERGDAEAAQTEFARLADGSPFRERPEVGQAVAMLADQELQAAGRKLASQPETALAHARTAVALPGLDEERQQAALALVGEAQKEIARAKAERSSSSRKRNTSSTPRPRHTVEAESGPSPMDEATACLAKADNQCVIRALAGKAKTAKEMALLIETYRALGNSQAATKYMGVYVKRFPSARQATSYRQTLARQGH